MSNLDIGQNSTMEASPIYTHHAEKKKTQRAERKVHAASDPAMPAHSWSPKLDMLFPPRCSRLDLRRSSMCKTLLKTSTATCSRCCHRGSPEDPEVPDLNTCCIRGLSKRLRAQGTEVGKTPKESGPETGLTSLNLLEGFSARCCDCAGW